MEGNKRFRVIVFDLDGTLADTADLAVGRRVPSQVLELSPPGAQPTRLEFSPEVSGLPGRLMADGAVVVIITRSPAAYASTLTSLLRLDYNAIIPSTHRTIDQKLTDIAAGVEVLPEQVLYVGDRERDREAAATAGCGFVRPAWIDGDPDDTSQFDYVVRPTRALRRQATPAAPEGTLLRALQRSASSGESLEPRAVEALRTCGIGEDTRAAIAWTLLRSAPCQSQRDRLRRMAFAAIPDSAYECIVPLRTEYSTAFVSRTLIRRGEYETDPDARDALAALIRRLHPTQRIHPFGPELADIPVYAFRSFNDQRGGEILRAAKDWGGAGKGHSRAEVKLSLLELPAVVLGTWLTGRTEPIVPAPASDFSHEKPGQASLRIAYDAAQFAGTPILNPLRKTDAGITCIEQGEGREVWLVDDQITWGGTLAGSAQALRAAGFRVKAAIGWSASRRWMTSGGPEQQCWLAGPSKLLRVQGACGPRHHVDAGHTWVAVGEMLESVDV